MQLRVHYAFLHSVNYDYWGALLASTGIFQNIPSMKKTQAGRAGTGKQPTSSRVWGLTVHIPWKRQGMAELGKSDERQETDSIWDGGKATHVRGLICQFFPAWSRRPEWIAGLGCWLELVARACHVSEICDLFYHATSWSVKPLRCALRCIVYLSRPSVMVLDLFIKVSVYDYFSSLWVPGGLSRSIHRYVHR